MHAQPPHTHTQSTLRLINTDGWRERQRGRERERERDDDDDDDNDNDDDDLSHKDTNLSTSFFFTSMPPMTNTATFNTQRQREKQTNRLADCFVRPKRLALSNVIAF